MFYQHLFNSLLLWSQYALLGLGFYFSSIGSRHFNFASGLAFLLAPYVAFDLVARGCPFPLAVASGLFAASLAGFLDHALNRSLYRRGSRPGQLLLISLALLAVGQNVLTLLVGNESKTFPFVGAPVFSEGVLMVTVPELVAFSAGGLAILAIGLAWRRSDLGVLMLALGESRVALSLRGWNVPAVERMAATLGFGLSGLAGVLAAIVLRIHPMMGFEMALIGVVGFVVGPLLFLDLRGILLTTGLIVLVRLPLVLMLEGDWGMTPTLLVLFLALAAKQVREKVQRSLQ